jgi:hypothetical protein
MNQLHLKAFVKESTSLPKYLLPSSEKYQLSLVDGHYNEFLQWFREPYSKKFLKSLGIKDILCSDGEVFETNENAWQNHKKKYIPDSYKRVELQLDYISEVPEDLLIKTCPFPQSEFQNLWYRRETTENVTKFIRYPWGIWLSTSTEYCAMNNPNYKDAIPLWIDIRKPYFPLVRGQDEHYGDIGKKFQRFVHSLKLRGYDCYVQGCETNSITVFGRNTKILNAMTGELM